MFMEQPTHGVVTIERVRDSEHAYDVTQIEVEVSTDGAGEREYTGRCIHCGDEYDLTRDEEAAAFELLCEQSLDIAGELAAAGGWR